MGPLRYLLINEICPQWKNMDTLLEMIKQAAISETIRNPLTLLVVKEGKRNQEEEDAQRKRKEEGKRKRVRKGRKEKEEDVQRKINI